MPVNNSIPVFSITVNNTQPIYAHCSQTGHCAKGMVFSVNAYVPVFITLCPNDQVLMNHEDRQMEARPSRHSNPSLSRQPIPPRTQLVIVPPMQRAPPATPQWLPVVVLQSQQRHQPQVPRQQPKAPDHSLIWRWLCFLLFLVSSTSVCKHEVIF
jgi:hypothetical protein